MMAASEETSCSPRPEEALPSKNLSQAMSVTLESECKELWRQFDSIGTEMIVTRRGRRMFPALKMELHNLNPNSFYVLLMDLVPVDKHRYKYQNSKWVKCFEEACAHTRLYVHPESPALGSYWMDHVVSFYKLKLTNNQLDSQGHIIVHSMHKYQPRLHIVESNDTKNLNWDNFNSFTFPGTQFTTVTAYQNDKITQLKIDNNPFAKGFRHPMPRHRIRPSVRYAVASGSSESGPEESMTIVGTKRPSSGSEDDTSSVPKLARFPSPVVQRPEDGLIPVTTQVNPALETVTSSNSPYKPVYIVYDRPHKASLTTAPCLMSNHHYVAKPSPPPLQKDITTMTSTTINSLPSSPFRLVRVPSSGSTKSSSGVIAIPPKAVSPKQYIASPTSIKKVPQDDNVSIVSDISSSDSDADMESTQSPVQTSPPLMVQLSPKHGSLPSIYNAPPTLASSVAQPTMILTPSHPPTMSLSPKASATQPTIVTGVPQQSIIIQTPNIISNPGQPIFLPMGPVPAGKVAGQNIIIPYSIVGSSPNGHIVQADQQQPIFQMIPTLPMIGTNGHCTSQGVQLIALNTQSSS